MNPTPCVDMIKAKSENPVFAYIIEQFSNNEIFLNGTFNVGHNYTFSSFSELDKIHFRKLINLASFRTLIEDRLQFELHYNYGMDSFVCNYVTFKPNNHNNVILMPCSYRALEIQNVSKLCTEESHFQQMTKHDCSGVHPDDIKLFLEVFNKCQEIIENEKC